MSKLKIGDKLYRYTGVSILSYEVAQKIEHSAGINYKIVCLDCRDHDQCQVLVAQDKKGKIVYIETLNDDSNNQGYWHSTDSDKYQAYEYSKNDAVKNRYLWTINARKKYIEDREKANEADKAKIIELEACIEALNEK